MRVPVFGSQPWVMGVVNVTPDSFSDGGRWLDSDAAIAHGRHLARAGAAIIDVGGESTRPGAHRVDAATERERVVPVIAALAAEGVICSVDTTRAEVASAAIEAGAAMVNDVSGGLADASMTAMVADAQVPWILMHWRGPSDTMNSLAHYDDVVAEVRDELLSRVDAALAAGVDERSLIIDPGLGFAKNSDHNWAVLAAIDALVCLGLPVLIGASRKRFLGALFADSEGNPRPPEGREVATAATSMFVAGRGVWGVRVHDVVSTLDVLAVLAHAEPQSQQRLQPQPQAQPQRHSYAEVAEKASAPPSPLADLADLADLAVTADPADRGAERGVKSGGAANDAPVMGALRRPESNQRHEGSIGDRVTLTGLTVRGHHGVFDFEKRDGQDFVIDVTVVFDIAAAARADDVAETINYAELADCAAKIVAGPPRDLIETVATDIAERIVARWPVREVEVTLHKPHAPIPLAFGDVAVTVRRSRQGQHRPAGQLRQVAQERQVGRQR